MSKFAFVAFTLCIGFGILPSAEAGNGRGNGNHGGGRGGFQVRSGNFGGHVHGNHRPQQFVQKVHRPTIGIHHNHHQNIHRHVVIAAPRFHPVPRFHNYHLTHARKFDFGYCYFGNTHAHWASTVWSAELGCTVYYCPSTLCWYYWCAPHNCFYPVTHCPLGTYAF